MSIRYECPRCQHLFAHDGAGDDAFAECPNCGSLALPAGESTSTDARVLKSISGQRLVSEDSGLPSAVDDATEASPGVFSGFLSEGGIAGEPSFDISDEDPTAAYPGGMPPSDEDLTMRTEEGAIANHRLPPSLLLTRASGEGRALASQEGPPVDEVTRPRLSPVDGVAPSSSFLDEGPTSSSGGRAVAPSPSVDDAPVVRSAAFAITHAPDPEPSDERSLSIPPELDLGDLDLDLPSSPRIPARPFSDEGTPVGFDRTDEGAAISDDRTTELRLPGSAEGRAMTLQELESSLGSGQDISTLLAGGGLNEDSFGALEQAFDEVARRPAQSRLTPQTAEDALRSGGGMDEISLITLRQKSEVPAPPAGGPAPPPLRLRRRQDMPHLALSDEAKRLAAIPLGVDDTSGPTDRATGRVQGAPELDDRPLPPHLAEATDVVLRREPEPAARTSALIPEAPVRAKGKVKPIDDAPKSSFGLGRIVLLATFSVVVGGGVGAAVAPPPDDTGSSPRKRAEEQLTAGNRFYDQERYDDALGAYRGALARDRTYGHAHRAKAAVLAKQSRWDEAAAAYEEYLAVEPDAIDADQVKEILARYRGEDTGK